MTIDLNKAENIVKNINTTTRKENVI